MDKKNINEGISCNVRNCVYNEHGCDCNLEHVCISRGEGGHHFCKSYISINDEEDIVIEENKINIESSDEYIAKEFINGKIDIKNKDIY